MEKVPSNTLVQGLQMKGYLLMESGFYELSMVFFFFLITHTHTTTRQLQWLGIGVS